MKRRKGFTIIELVIVISVIAILAAVLIPTFASVTNKAEKAKAQLEAKNLVTEVLANVVAEKNEDADLLVFSHNGKAVYLYGYGSSEGHVLAYSEKLKNFTGSDFKTYVENTLIPELKNAGAIYEISVLEDSDWRNPDKMAELVNNIQSNANMLVYANYRILPNFKNEKKYDDERKVVEVSTSDDFISALGGNGTRRIKLLNDLKIGDAEHELYVNGDDVIIDLNDKVLKIPNTITFNNRTAKKVTFLNGNVTTSAVYWDAFAEGKNFAPYVSIFSFDSGSTTLTLDNVTLDYVENAEFNCAISVDNGSNIINLKNSTINARISLGYGTSEINITNTIITDERTIKEGSHPDLINIANSEYRGTVNIYSGIFKAKAGRNVIDISSKYTYLNIYGGTFTCEEEDSATMFKEIGVLDGSSSVTIYGGSFNGKSILEYAKDNIEIQKLFKDSAEYKYELRTIAGGAYEVFREKING